MLYYQYSPDAVLKEVGSQAEGLSNAEATERLAKHGPNRIHTQYEPLWHKLIAPFTSPFMWVLLAAAAVSLFHNELLDAIIIGLVVTVSAGIYYVQRFSTDRILKALQQRETQKVRVKRANSTRSIEADSLVPGDIVLLHEAEKVPADLRLIQAENVRCDEALLTGESLPVSKQIESIAGKKPLSEQASLLLQGTYLVSGQAIGVVVGTGNQTEFGSLATLTASAEISSPVQQKIDRLLGRVIMAVLATATLAFGLALYRGMELLAALRFVMALAVSAVPEGLPVAISVILVLGMRRLAKQRALVRNMQAMENIGTVTVIATDKTGTLTKNNLEIQTVWQAPTGQTQQILPLVINSHGSDHHDPLDQALFRYQEVQHSKAATRLRYHATLPFSLNVAMSGNLWQDGSRFMLAVKGAPEQILQRSKITQHDRKAAQVQLEQYAAKGYKVLALAHTSLTQPIKSIEETPAKNLSFDGFICVADELRPTANKAVAEAKAAGIRIIMITGDHLETAFAIASSLGIASDSSQVFDSQPYTKQHFGTCS